ncbi:MAG: methanogen output domain 1-containing protein [Thiotrichaceae bacterium]|nr:methanogen output domain 1-containing protein [Thiotrichaceae bacterium]MBL1260834.1 methanogen output domain 1-containing protein [Thiotrichaceae bacterium]
MDNSAASPTNTTKIKDLDIPLERDLFLRTLIRELAGTLQDVVGLKESEGYISIVGQSMGAWINSYYKEALGQSTLSREQIIDVLVDLKARICGDFYVVKQDEENVMLRNRECPFGDKVKDRPCMCMMTSNVFGSITADSMKYAKVELRKTIAKGDRECEVVVHFKRSEAAKLAQGREYFGGE